LHHDQSERLPDGHELSRFGFRGTESLGGLNAIFQVESSIDPARFWRTLAGRESFIGLQGGWGTAKSLPDTVRRHPPIFGNVPT
jgi:predicted porin